MKFSGEVAPGPRRKCFYFDGNPDSFVGCVVRDSLPREMAAVYYSVICISQVAAVF